MSWCSAERTSRARKRHQCQLCLEAVEPRTTYTTWFWVDGGDNAQVRVHSECWALYKEYGELDPYEGGFIISYEHFADALRWSDASRESFVKVGAERGGYLWDVLFKKNEEEDEGME